VDGRTAAIEHDGKAVFAVHAVARLVTDTRGFDGSLVRIETTIENARPDGGVLRIVQEPGRNPSEK
jgi:hypothetical protein